MNSAAARPRRRRNTILLPALASALLIYFLWTYLETGSPPSFEYIGAKPVEHSPEFYFEQVDSRRFDSAGALKLHIQGDSIVQQPGDGSALVARPQATLYQQDQASWTLQSQSAIVWPGASQVDLRESVNIRSADGSTLLNSQAFTVYPEERRLATDEAVTLKNTYGRLQAVGLRADLEQQQFELLHDVRGQYLAKP